MTSLQINENSIPSLAGKVALITGGASGIGYSAAKILARQGAEVHILDVNPPKDANISSLITYRKCDMRTWAELSRTFLAVGHIDMVFANAGIGEHEVFLQENLAANEEGSLLEPTYPVLDVNFRAVLNVVKLSWMVMKRQSEGGSIVLTASATAYTPDASVPLYSALKAALVGLVRSLRPSTPSANITINAVAPFATNTPGVPQAFLAPLLAENLPVSTADFVGLALVYSATAKQSRRVEAYGKDKDTEDTGESRWNGRVILTMGERYTEIEGSLAELRPTWLGEENSKLAREQQAATDLRENMSS